MQFQTKHNLRIAPVSSKTYLLLALAGTLAACSGGSNADSVTYSQNALPATIVSVEASGALPKLDRSTSVAGPDVDKNGIRDDIDSYLATKNYPAAQLAAAQQGARSLQAALIVDVSNRTKLRTVDADITNALSCLGRRFNGSIESFNEIANSLQELTANTKERVKAYMAYNKALDGTTTALPQVDTCEK